MFNLVAWVYSIKTLCLTMGVNSAITSSRIAEEKLGGVFVLGIFGINWIEHELNLELKLNMVLLFE